MYPGAKWRKQQQGQPPAQAQPQQPAVPHQPPGPPPPYSAPAAPPMATAYVVPASSSGSDAAAMYAPVVSVAPSAPDLPPPTAPPPMAGPVPASMYTPVGAPMMAGPPRPLPPAAAYAQAQAQAQRPQQQHQPMPPQQAMAYGGRPDLPQGSAYYSQGNLQGAIPFSSPCNGRRRALFIGITYKGTRAQLNGCVNDVKNLYQFITRAYGFQRKDIRVRASRCTAVVVVWGGDQSIDRSSLPSFYTYPPTDPDRRNRLHGRGPDEAQHHGVDAMARLRGPAGRLALLPLLGPRRLRARQVRRRGRQCVRDCCWLLQVGAGVLDPTTDLAPT